METPRDPGAEPPADAVGSSPTPPEPTPEPAPPTGAQVQSVPPPPAQPPAAPAPPAQPPAAPPPASWAPPAEELVGPAPGYQFGGAGERLVAYILDTLIIAVLSLILFIAGHARDPAGATARRPVVARNPRSSGSSTSRGTGSRGPRRSACGRSTSRSFATAMVARSAGGTAIIRLIGLYIIDSIVLGIPIGLLWVFVDKRKRCWHDLLASTVVVKRAV